MIMLEKIIKIGIYLILFIPLLVSPSTLYPYVFGKAIAFQIIVEVLFILWLVLLAQNKIKISWTKINIALLSFFVILVLSTLLSLDIQQSFWSSAERMTGLFNWLHFGLYFLILSTIFSANNGDYKWLLRISLFVSVIVSTWSLIDWQPRLFGPLGNPGFLACYLLFHIFFAFYLFFKDKNLYWRIAYILITILNLITFYFTSTRGAYYGLFVGLLLFSLLFILKRSKKIGFILLISFILIGGFGVYWQRARFLQTEEARMVSWQISWRAFKERPILGWGPENYILAFAKHYDPDWPITEWFDKAHSNFWEFSVTTGILGLLAYLGLFILGVINHAPTGPILIAYFIMQLFWIDTTITLMLFFMTLVLCEKRFMKI
ncbi:MAG: hypothetical protein COX44_02355 [Candidatus Portnoybacteria bacterium CG23_combo_of_CG06-09_8_20_14_all_37_13]|uniref:O-antigen ligase-related domain-containing protein n=1 Tax=Candidatus Portnoybacteria bacterium CG23_combo_of_CG06-09_8_20_14_all_37_13 TaxID=1974819 RepID=A0A2G9YCP5_9BACT|nr:MAG: hypothetical protein COX44_02355 [Candidatus Portnoybacteria bacterium CG23_combo_of_CG06-09_8_20_14_all_37_13]